MEKEQLKQVLGELVATANSGKYKTHDEVLSKFPELSGFDKDALGEFIATSNSGKYKSHDEVLSKFPEFFQPTEVKKKESASALPSQGLPGSPVSGGQQKTVSQPTVESGVQGGQQVPAAKPGTPPVSGGVAKPEFGDDLIKSISEKPTEELVWNYIGNISPGLLPKAPTQADVTLGVSESLTESNRFKEKAGRELLIDLDRIRNSAMSPEAKMLRSKELIAAKVQQMVAAKPELAGDITAPIAIREDLVKSEKLAREANPAAFSEIMDDRMNTAALKSDIVEGWNPADPIGSYKNKMISTAIQIGMDKNDPRYKEAFMINNLSRVKSNPNSSPELIKKYENEIKVFRDARIAESMAKIREEETAIAEMEASGGFDQVELNEAKARLKAVKNDIDGYLNPDKAAVSAYAATDSKSAPGETPMEQMKNHLARLVHERNELRGSISGPEQVVGVFADSERGKRLDEVEAQIKVLTPVVLLNEAPEFTGTEEQGFGGAYARSFMQGLFPKGWVQRPVSRQEQAQSVLQSFAQAGVDIANYDPAKLDALNERSKGYGIGDMRYIGEVLGGTSAFMIQAVPGGAAVKPLQIGKIISGSKYFGRAANVIAEAVESGLAYEASGRIVPKADENLNFAAGALGGAGKAMFELMPFLNKEGQSAVKKFILGRAGGAAGETIEETGNTIGEVWEKHGMDNFVKGMGEQFQSVDDVVKFIVTTAVMGAALGTGTDVGRELVNESQQRFEGASPEQQAVAQGMIDELKSDAVNIQKEGAKVLTEQATAQGIEQPIEAAQAFEVGKGGEFVETEEQSIRFKNKAEMDEFLADKAAFPEAYANAKNEVKKFRFRQQNDMVGKHEPVNTLRGLGAEPVAADQTVDTNVIQDKFGVTLQLNTDTGETEVVANEGTTPDQVEAAKSELSKGGVQVAGVVPVAAEVMPETPIEPTAQAPVAQDLEAEKSAAVRALIDEGDDVGAADELFSGIESFDDLDETAIEQQLSKAEAKVTPSEVIEAKAATAPESKAKAYDFDNTLYDPKTGQLTPLGEEVKARIAAGEEITIVTARNGNQTAAITKALGISKDKIQATGDEAKKGEVLDRLGIAREDYYDADQAKMEAIQGRVPAAPEATMEPTAPVVQEPVTPAQKPTVEPTPVTEQKTKARKERASKAKEKPVEERTPDDVVTIASAPETTADEKAAVMQADDKRVDNITASMEGKTPSKVMVVVDGKEQVGDVTNVYTHPKSGKEVYTVAVTDSEGKKTTKDVLAHMADVSEWNETSETQRSVATVDTKQGQKPIGSQKVKKSYDKWRDAAMNFMSVGVMDDPKAEAKKLKALLDATLDLGVAVFEAGITDLEGWTKRMQELIGNKLDKSLPKFYEASKRRVESKASAASTTGKSQQGKQAAAEPEVEEEQEKNERGPKLEKNPLSTTGKTRQRGVEQTIQKHPDVGGEELDGLIKQAPTFYEVMDQEEVMAVAKAQIEEQGFEKLLPSLLKTGVFSPVKAAVRMLAIQAYSQQAAAARRAGELDLADEIMDNVENLLMAHSEDNTRAGQFTSMMSHFGLIAPQLDMYVESRARAMAKKVLDKADKNGVTTKQKTDNAAKELNQAKKDRAKQIADAVVSEPEVSDAKVDPERARIKKELESAKKELKAALANSMKSMNSGIPVHNLLDFAAAATKVGYYMILDGAHSMKDFIKKMKEAGVDDEDFLKDLWESGEYNGTSLSGLAKSESAATTVTKGIAAEKRTPSEAAKQKAELTKKIRDAIARHLVEPDGRTLENALVEDLDLAPESAQKIVQATANKTADELGGAIKQKANSIVNNAAKELTKAQRAEVAEAKKSVTGRLVYALVNGDVTGNDVAKAMAEKLGLPSELTQKQRDSLRDSALAIAGAKEGSKIRDAAEWAFAKEADAALQQISRGSKSFFQRMIGDRAMQVYNSLVYAAMLNGLPTHMKNFLSVAPNIIKVATLDAMNIPKWMRAAKFAGEYKGSDADKMRVLWLASPVYEQLMRMKFAGMSGKIARKEAMDTLWTGRGYYKWDDVLTQSDKSVDRMIQAIPVLERIKFLGGKWNPYNHIFGKLAGRALAATDMLTSMYYENQELPFAIVAEQIKAGESIQNIKKKVNSFVTGADQRWIDSLAEAEETAAASEKLGFKANPKTVKAEAARLMREKIKSEAGIGVEKAQAIRDVAKDRIFAYKRHGIMGQLAEILSGKMLMANNVTAPLAPFMNIALKPIIPFTNIVGNMADAFLDTLPIYGMMRANGVSPTALLKMWADKKAEQSGSVNKGVFAKGAMMGSSRSLDDDLYVQQMSRAVFGTLVYAMAMAMAGDDEDDLIYLSGKNDSPAKAYKLYIGGKPVLDYRMSPSMFLPLRMVNASNEYKKNPENYDASYLETMGLSYFDALKSIKDMSFLEGVTEFAETIGYASKAFDESGNSMDKFGDFLWKMGTGLGRQHIQFAMKPLPTNQGIVRNFEKVANPTLRSKQDGKEILAHFFGLQSIFNEKRVDLFGNEIKGTPGDDIFPISYYRGFDDASREYTKMFEDQKVSTKASLNTKRTFNEPDPEGNPFTQRKMTPDEYGRLSVLAGQKLSEAMAQYTSSEGYTSSSGNTHTYEQDKNEVYIESGGKKITKATKRLQGLKGSAWSAAMMELFGEQILDQEELDLLLGQEFD